jgi:hypothetical protein
VLQACQVLLNCLLQLNALLVDAAVHVQLGLKLLALCLQLLWSALQLLQVVQALCHALQKWIVQVVLLVQLLQDLHVQLCQLLHCVQGPPAAIPLQPCLHLWPACTVSNAWSSSALALRYGCASHAGV